MRLVSETGDAHFLPLAVEAGVVQALHGWWLARVTGEVQQKVVHTLFIRALPRASHRDVQLGDVVLVYSHLDCAVLLKFLHFLLNPLNASHLLKWKHFANEKSIWEMINSLLR